MLLILRRATLGAGYAATVLWAMSSLFVFSSVEPSWPATTLGIVWIAGLLVAIATEIAGSPALYLVTAVIVTGVAATAVGYFALLVGAA